MQLDRSIAVALVLATSLAAQCFEQNLGALATRGANPPGVGDDVLFDLRPLNFSFPLGGVAASYTHAHVQSNGVVFLTNGANSGATTQGYSTVASTQVNNLRGTAGEPPRIAPFWRDLVLAPANDGGVWINDTLPGKFVVTWRNAVQFNTVGPVFTIQAQILATGEVTFFYDGATVSSQPVICGVSRGNGIAAVPGLDLSTPGSTTTQLAFERFPANSFDLAANCVRFAPSGGGFTTESGQLAAHTNFGQGCYDLAAASFYQGFATAAGARAALNGQSMVLTPTANGYTATWGGATYQVPGVGATPLTLADDGEVGVALSQPLPNPFGATSSLRVNANGVVTLGTNPQTFPGTNPYTPTPAALLAASGTAFWSWHDYNPAEVGSGSIKFEEVLLGGAPVALVTWDNVESWSQPLGTNPSRLQFQLNLATGVVAIVWLDIDDNGTSQYGSGHLIGFSPGGASADPGPITLASALPLTTSPDLLAMTLTASPAPISTLTTGTLVTYTTSNMPEAAPGSGVYVGTNILSLAGIAPPGVELGFLGAPGCYAHVLTLSVLQTLLGNTPTLQVQFPIPAGVPGGFELFSQSVALITPFSLPGGLNAFGLVTSNGVRSYVSPF